MARLLVRFGFSGSRTRRLIGVGSAAALVVGVVTGVASPASAAPPSNSPHAAPKVAHARTWQTGKSNKRPASTPKKSTAPYQVSKNGEIPSLRTRFSSTFEHGNAYQTAVSTAPVNYKNSAGDWVPINDALQKNSAGVASPTADDYSVQLPADLSQPVVSSKGDLTVSSQLHGASAVTSTTSGSTATYANALPGVDALYTVHSDFLEEQLRLHSASAPSSYAFTVSLPSGYSLRSEADRSLSIVDTSGDVAGSLPAPVIRDSSADPDTNTSTDIHYSVSGSAPDYTVTIAASSAWLQDAARVYPVTIDPSVSFGAAQDLGCYISDPTASDTSLCATNTGADNDLLYGHTAHTRHILLNFGDLTATSSPIPADAVVTNARLDLHVKSFSNTGVGMNTAVYRITQSWNSGVTWNTSDGTTSWTAGGAFGPTIIDNTSFTPTTGGTLSLYPTLLVNGWIHGDYQNNGLGIKLLNDSGNNTATFYGMANSNHPTLTVTWQPTVGQQSWIQAYDHKLTDRIDLHVDLGSRNLVLNNTDEALSGPGQNLIVRRTYNSALAAAGTSSDVGTGWSLNGGTDVHLTSSNSAVVLTQPGGAPAIFYRNFAESDLTKDDAFVPAPGLDATLTRPDGTHFKLSFHTSHVIQNFTRPTSTATVSSLSSVQDRAHDGNDNGGNVIDWNISGSPSQTNSVTDTTGQRSVNFTYTSGQITAASESLAGGASGRSWGYHYDGSGHLTSYTDPAGKTTLYCYTGNLITTIVSPRGTAAGNTCTSGNGTGTTVISYDSGGGVTSIRYENPPGVSDDVLTFAQHLPPTKTQNGETDQTDTYGNLTAYYFDTNDRVVKVRDPLGNTRATTFNTNNDVTAGVSPNNFTGGGSDPSTTASYNANTNTLASLTLPQVGSTTAASITLTYNPSGSGGSYLPSKITDDRGNPTGLSYSGGAASIITGDQGGTDAAKGFIYYEGDTYPDNTTVHCGPSSGAAYPGALCETDDPLHTSGSQGHRSVYQYDSMGELVTIGGPVPGHGRSQPANTTIGYDNYSRQTSVTDGKSQQTQYSYDLLDRLTKITYDDGSTTTYTYDEDGDRTAAIDKNPSGTITHQDSYTYDTQDRLSTDTNGSNPAITLTYDANSHVLTYDDAGGTVTYGYDAGGGLTSLAEPGGDCTGYSPTNPPTTASLCTIFALDKDGNRELTIYPGDNDELSATYDAAGRLATLKATAGTTTLYDNTYSYAVSGTDSLHIAQITNQDNNSYWQYAYDGLNRLTTARSVNSAGSVTSRYVYCYDQAGNRVSAVTGTSATCPATPQVSYDDANQALSNTDGTTYTYDLDGNLTKFVPGGTGPGTSYTLNDRNQVTGVTTSSGTNTMTYAGPDNTELLSETSGGSTTSLLNSPLGISAVTTGGSTTYITRDPSGTPIGTRDAAGSSGVNHAYYLTDERGSITAAATAAGTLTHTYTYDPYGTVTSSTSPDLLGYIGGYSGAADTSTIKLGDRYYNPAAGAFTQIDPNSGLAHPGRDNPYTYAGADPIDYSDPTGASIWGDIAGAVVSVYTAARATFSGYGFYNAYDYYLSSGFSEDTIFNLGHALAGVATSVVPGAFVAYEIFSNN